MKHASKRQKSDNKNVKYRHMTEPPSSKMSQAEQQGKEAHTPFEEDHERAQRSHTRLNNESPKCGQSRMVIRKTKLGYFL